MKNLLFALVVVFAGCRGWETEERPVHIIKNMDMQEKGKAYRRDSTGLFADGRTSRLPVEGTVAQGFLEEDVLWEEGIVDAESARAKLKELEAAPINDEQLSLLAAALKREAEAFAADGGTAEPTKAFPASVKASFEAQAARGHDRFNIYCMPCHGQALDGKGTVAGLALDGGPRLTVPPPSLHLERISKDMVVGKIYSAIRNGVNGGNMPSYAAQIPVADRWAIVAYVKSEQMKKDSSVPMEPGGLQAVEVKVASAEAGASLYKSKTCNACHSTDGSRIVGPTFKGIWGRSEETSGGTLTVDLAYVKESVRNPQAKIVNGYPPAMPAQQLTDLELESIALFMQTLK